MLKPLITDRYCYCFIIRRLFLWVISPKLGSSPRAGFINRTSWSVSELGPKPYSSASQMWSGFWAALQKAVREGAELQLEGDMEKSTGGTWREKFLLWWRIVSVVLPGQETLFTPVHPSCFISGQVSPKLRQLPPLCPQSSRLPPPQPRSLCLRFPRHNADPLGCHSVEVLGAP